MRGALTASVARFLGWPSVGSAASLRASCGPLCGSAAAVGVALLAGGSAEVMLELLGRLFLESGHELLDGLASDLYVAGHLIEFGGLVAVLWFPVGRPADVSTVFGSCPLAFCTVLTVRCEALCLMLRHPQSAPVSVAPGCGSCRLGVGMLSLSH